MKSRHNGRNTRVRMAVPAYICQPFRNEYNSIFTKPTILLERETMQRQRRSRRSRNVNNNTNNNENTGNENEMNNLQGNYYNNYNNSNYNNDYNVGNIEFGDYNDQLSMHEQVYSLDNQIIALKAAVEERRIRQQLEPFTDLTRPIAQKAPEYENIIRNFGATQFDAYYTALRNNCNKESLVLQKLSAPDAFCMPVWDEKNQRLNYKQYVHVYRSRANGNFVCDCKRWRFCKQWKCEHTLITTMNTNEQLGFSDIANDLPQKKIIDSDGRIVLIGTFKPRWKDSRIVRVYSVAPKSRYQLRYVVVKFYSGGQTSCSHHQGRRYCRHTARVAHAIGASLKDLYNFHKKYQQMRVATTRIWVKKPVSRKRIPLLPSWRCYIPGMMDDMKSYDEYDSYKRSERNIKDPLDCDYSNCQDCGASLTNCPNVRRPGILYMIEEAVDVTVGAKKCLACGHWNHFDGYGSHIMNRDTFELYDHSLCFQFYSNVYHQKRFTINSFAKVGNDTYTNNRSKYPFPDRRKIWEIAKSFGYILLLRCIFACIACDDNLRKNINLPIKGSVRETVADGLQTSFSNIDANTIINPTHVFDPEYVVDTIINMSDRFIPSKPHRQLLARYLYRRLPPVNQDRDPKGKRKNKANYLPVLRACDITTLKSYLRSNGYKPVIEMMEWIETDQYKNLDNDHKQFCADFFRCLSTDESVYAISPSKINDILIGGAPVIGIPQNVELIKQKSPLIFAILFDMPNNFEWGEWMYRLLKNISAISQRVIHARKSKAGPNGHWEERKPTEEQLAIWDNYYEHGTLFSGTACRQLPRFLIDIKREESEKRAKENKKKEKNKNKKRKNNQSNSNNNNNNNDGVDDSVNEMKREEILEEVTSCQKRFVDQSQKPAMLVIRCLPHGMMIGSDIMTTAEGPKQLFSFFLVNYEKFPNKCTVDFSCLYKPYAFNRAPALTEDTTDVSDEFHHLDHTGCSQAYCIKYHKSYNEDWSIAMDEACEQGNVPINKIRHLGIWSTRPTFLFLSAFIMEMENRRKTIALVGHEGVERTPQYQIDPNNLPSWADKYARYHEVPCAGNINWNCFLSVEQQSLYFQNSRININENLNISSNQNRNVNIDVNSRVNPNSYVNVNGDSNINISSNEHVNINQNLNVNSNVNSNAISSININPNSNINISQNSHNDDIDIDIDVESKNNDQRSETNEDLQAIAVEMKNDIANYDNDMIQPNPNAFDWFDGDEDILQVDDEELYMDMMAGITDVVTDDRTELWDEINRLLDYINEEDEPK